MYTLIDGREMNEQFPETFDIPSRSDILKLQVGDNVKIGFEEEGKRSERMWVLLTDINGEDFEGILNNDPFNLETIKYDDTLKFNSKHILATE